MNFDESTMKKSDVVSDNIPSIDFEVIKFVYSFLVTIVVRHSTFDFKPLGNGNRNTIRIYRITETQRERYAVYFHPV